MTDLHRKLSVDALRFFIVKHLPEAHEVNEAYDLPHTKAAIWEWLHHRHPLLRDRLLGETTWPAWALSDTVAEKRLRKCSGVAKTTGHRCQITVGTRRISGLPIGENYFCVSHMPDLPDLPVVADVKAAGGTSEPGSLSSSSSVDLNQIGLNYEARVLKTIRQDELKVLALRREANQRIADLGGPTLRCGPLYECPTCGLVNEKLAWTAPLACIVCSS